MKVQSVFTGFPSGRWMNGASIHTYSMWLSPRGPLKPLAKLSHRQGGVGLPSWPGSSPVLMCLSLLPAGCSNTTLTWLSLLGCACRLPTRGPGPAHFSYQIARVFQVWTLKRAPAGLQQKWTCLHFGISPWRNTGSFKKCWLPGSSSYNPFSLTVTFHHLHFRFRFLNIYLWC